MDLKVTHHQRPHSYGSFFARTPQRRPGNRDPHRSLVYSALACCRMGMSGSASFQSVRNSC